MFKKILLCLVGTLFISNFNISNADLNNNQDVPILIENNVGLNNIEIIDNNENNNNNQFTQNILQISRESLLGRFDYSTQKLMEYIKSNEFYDWIKIHLKKSKFCFDNSSEIINYDAIYDKIAEHRSTIEHHSSIPGTGIWNEIPMIFQEGIPAEIQETIKNKLFHYFPHTLTTNDIAPSKDINGNFYFQCVLPHEFVITPNNTVSEEKLCLLILSIKMDLLEDNVPNTNIHLLAKYLLKLYTDSPNNIQQEMNRYRRYLTDIEKTALNNLLRNYYMLDTRNIAHNLANYL